MRRQNAAHSGFTLVELMVVIVIIALLAGILTTSVWRIRQSAKAQASRATLHTIAGACNLYKNDFECYPPSSDPVFPAGIQEKYANNSVCVTGAQRVAFFVVGPGKGNYLPAGHQPLNRGKVYGPYNGAQNLPVTGASPVFLDTFGNPFLYYRFDPAVDARGNRTWPLLPLLPADHYYNVDNAVDGTIVKAIPADADAYGKKGDGTYCRRDFLLLSAGEDGKFASPTNPNCSDYDARSDDINNLLNE